MKKALLIYNDFNRETQKTLNDITELLVNTLRKLGIEDCTVDTCQMTCSKEKSEEYDIVAGYHIKTDTELYLSDKFPGRYVHFFDSHHKFAFANVTKHEEMSGYMMYTISPITV